MSELSEGNLSPAMRRIIKRAAVEAEASGTTEIAVVHVLIGMLQEGQNVASQLLAEKEITVESLRLLDFKK
jgi:ATP-dependent Clp protease ATP-binding subunit ClpA